MIVKTRERIERKQARERQKHIGKKEDNKYMISLESIIICKFALCKFNFFIITFFVCYLLNVPVYNMSHS